PDADVLDDPDRGDLVEAQARRQIPVVAVVDTGAPLEASAPDGRGGPLGLCGRERHAIGLDAVPLGGPHDQAPPAATDVEQPVAGGQAELPAHEVEIVRLRLVEVAVRVAVVGARVDHARVQKERVEVVRHVVVEADGFLVVAFHFPGSHRYPIPKAPSRTRLRRSPGRVQASRARPMTMDSGMCRVRRASPRSGRPNVRAMRSSYAAGRPSSAAAAASSALSTAGPMPSPETARARPAAAPTSMNRSPASRRGQPWPPAPMTSGARTCSPSASTVIPSVSTRTARTRTPSRTCAPALAARRRRNVSNSARTMP